MTHRQLLSGIQTWLLLLTSAANGFAGDKEDIGLTALLAELGGATPTGAGVRISQVESPLSGNYSANPADPEFAGKTITLKSGVTGGSSHATVVALSCYGNTNGIAPGITQIDAYEVNAWLTTNFLRLGNSTAAPLAESRRLQNHSWVGSTGNQTADEEILRRFDYAIQRDGFVAIVGLNNLNTNPVPALLAHAYNAIVIGVPSGNHSTGGTTFDTAGRIKPDLVAPSVYYAVSFSCGVASGAAAVLLHAADAAPALANARTNSEVIKAVLLAGATKRQFPSWTRTTTQPLDLVYGAGQVNVQNSYHLLQAGEQSPSSSVTVSNRGWDFATTTASPARYFFTVPAGYALTNFSTVLTWNRAVADTNPGPTFALQTSVANLSLRLYSATNFTLGPQLDSSVSPNQNVEHIFAPMLASGRYALEVTSDTTGTDYGLAWGGALLAQVTTSINQPAWGSVSPPSGSYLVGTPLTFVATPAPYFLFSNWSGSLTTPTNSVPLILTTNLTVTANFAERFTTNQPTPYWWLAAAGYPNNQETIITNLGANGFPLWQSYVAGLTPTNPASQLKFTSQYLLHATNLVLTWNTVTGRVYTLWTSPNAANGFTPLAGAINLPANIQAFTNPLAPAAGPKYYRLQVQKP